jgi:uncharacterized protein YegL
MRDDLTEIVFIVDRSGSMGMIRNDVIGGFNTFIKDQKAVPGNANVSLIQFDDKYEVNYLTKDINQVEDLNAATYQPRGMTALNDAIGKTIISVGDKLAKISETDRPGKVVFVIMTDGHENNSKEYVGAAGTEQIKKMITHQKEKYNWEFLFIGGDLDVQAMAQTYNFDTNKVLCFDKSAKGTETMYATLSASISNYRGGAKLSFEK